MYPLHQISERMIVLTEHTKTISQQLVSITELLVKIIGTKQVIGKKITRI